VLVARDFEHSRSRFRKTQQPDSAQHGRLPIARQANPPLCRSIVRLQHTPKSTWLDSSFSLTRRSHSHHCFLFKNSFMSADARLTSRPGSVQYWSDTAFASASDLSGTYGLAGNCGWLRENYRLLRRWGVIPLLKGVVDSDVPEIGVLKTPTQPMELLTETPSSSPPTSTGLLHITRAVIFSILRYLPALSQHLPHSSWSRLRTPHR